MKAIISLFVGENSRKRQIGIGLAILLSALYFTGSITLELYEALMPLVVLWTGAAFSAKLTKLQKAVTKATAQRK